jgi:hypothetical protein
MTHVLGIFPRHAHLRHHLHPRPHLHLLRQQPHYRTQPRPQRPPPPHFHIITLILPPQSLNPPRSMTWSTSAFSYLSNFETQLTSAGGPLTSISWGSSSHTDRLWAVVGRGRIKQALLQQLQRKPMRARHCWPIHAQQRVAAQNQNVGV